MMICINPVSSENNKNMINSQLTCDQTSTSEIRKYSALLRESLMDRINRVERDKMEGVMDSGKLYFIGSKLFSYINIIRYIIIMTINNIR